MIYDGLVFNIEHNL